MEFGDLVGLLGRRHLVEHDAQTARKRADQWHRARIRLAFATRAQTCLTSIATTVSRASDGSPILYSIFYIARCDYSEWTSDRAAERDAMLRLYEGSEPVVLGLGPPCDID